MAVVISSPRHQKKDVVMTHKQWIALFAPVRKVSLDFCRSLDEVQFIRVFHDKQKNGTTRSHIYTPGYSWKHHKVVRSGNMRKLFKLIDEELEKIKFPEGTKKYKDRTFISPVLEK